MLVLQRKAGESLVIGEDIIVSVVAVENGRVRLAITAPSDVPILRNELITATAANRDSAMSSEPDELIDLMGSVMGNVSGHDAPPEPETADEKQSQDKKDV